MYIHDKEKLLAIFLIVFFLFFYPYYADTVELTLDDIIEGFRFHASAIESGKGHYTLEYSTTELGAKRKKEAHHREGVAPCLSRYYDVAYYFEGDKFRYNVFAKSIAWFWWKEEGERQAETRTYTEHIYDGETAVRVNYELGRIIASLTDDPEPGAIAMIRPRGMYLGIRRIDEVIQSHDFELVGIDILNGESLYIVEGSWPEGGIFNSRLWINPSKGYLVQRAETITERGSVKPDYVVSNQFKEYPGGIWFLSRSVAIEYSIDKATERMRELNRTVMEVKDFEINVDVPDGIFEPAYEKGTVVYDKRTGQIYTVE